MVTVERRHREDAWRVVRFEEPHDGAPRAPRAWLAWLETGELPASRTGMYGEMERAHDLAQYGADAEQRGRDVERADVLATMAVHTETMLRFERDNNEEGSTYDTRQELAVLTGLFTREEHVGAAARQQGGG